MTPPACPEAANTSASHPTAWIADVAPGQRPASEPELRHVLAAAMRSVSLDVPGLDAGPLDLPRVDRAVVVLVDGLGIHNLALRSGHAPYLRRLLQNSPSDPATGLPSVRTCAPSTTAAAITSFGTGVLPGQHGMVGYEARDPVHGRPVSLISWQDATITPRGVQTVQTLAERAVAAGEGDAIASITPAAFVGTGLTQAALRGWTPRTAETLAARVDATVATFRRTDARLAYLYWGELDHIGHNEGWTSDAWVAELEQLDAELGRLSRNLSRLPGETLILITADHGMLDAGTRHDVTAEPQLGQGVATITGDQRAPHLHLSEKPGHPAEPELAAEVAERWGAYFAARGVAHVIQTRAELTGPGGLLGPLGASAQALIGDVIAFLGDDHVVVDPRSQSESYCTMPGVHGSLTAQEFYAPLLVEVV